MPLTRSNTVGFHLKLYAGELQDVVLLKRNDDQAEGTVTAYQLFNCLLPGNVVEGNVVGASKAFYSGEAVEMEFGGGSSSYRLRLTINHPILTPSGFIPAGKLQPGDYILSNKGEINRAAVKNIQHGPALIENVFETFVKSPRVLRYSIKATPFDLHGDGASVKGNIDIVRANRKLLGDWDFERAQVGSNNIFIGPDTSPGKVEANSPFRLGLSTKNQAPTFRSRLGWTNRLSPLFRRRISPLEKINIFSTSSSHAVTGKKFTQRRSPNTIPAFQFREGGTRQIFIDDSGFIDSACNSGTDHLVTISPSLSLAPERYTSFDKPVSYDRAAGAISQADLPRGLTGKVASHAIINIKRFHYEGPVYDLETTQGYFTTGYGKVKPIVSNCWRDNISKTSQPIQGDMAASHSTRWLIPSSEITRVGVNYLNVLDRIVDQYNMYWQPESGQDLTLSQFELYYWLACIRVDPSPNGVLLGNPGIPLGLA